MPPSPRSLLPRPALFWSGVVLCGAGVGEHLYMFLSAAPEFDLAMMGMTPLMWGAMAAIVVGVVMSACGLVRPRGAVPAPPPPPRDPASPHAARDRRRLVGLMTFALLVDQMKPATLSFIEPGMQDEYGLSTGEVAWLPTVALTGTVVGSLLWGRAADRIGRRATILASSLLFFGTTVCGSMTSFAGNLVMCGMMGMAAGGMLPVVYALMTESLPPGRRAVIMVLQAGLTTTGGYMAASGLAAVLIPVAGWRVLWFAQLPLVLVPIALNHWIPESAAFSAAAAGSAAPSGETSSAPSLPASSTVPVVPVPPRKGAAGRMPASALFRHPYTARTLVVTGYALAWGLVYWGFVTFLPGLLSHGHHGMPAATLLFLSSLLAVPASAVAALLYTRWSARGTMAAYAFLTVAALVALAAIGTGGSGAATLTAVMALFAGTAGVIALLGPYTAEIYPTAIRGTAGGWAAAVGKSGGAFGPPLIALVLAAPGGVRTAALLVAVPVALAAVAVVSRGSDPHAAPSAAAEDRAAGDPAGVLAGEGRP